MKLKSNLPTVDNFISEYYLPYESLIGAWFIPENECDTIIDFHKKHVPEKDEDIEVNNKFEHVDATYVTANLYKTSDLKNYANYLNEIMERYKQKYFYSNIVSEYRIREAVNVQHYKPNGGYKVWHCENNGKDNALYRHLVFMTYLNDLDEGGTEFLYQGLKLPAKKGLTLIWPSAWTHTHKGVISKTQEKYIITGWFSFEGVVNT